MYEYYLKCNFLNARLFRKFPKERVEYTKTSWKRIELEKGYGFKLEDHLYDSFVHPITYLQMANVLYYMCDRPLVSTRHKTHNTHDPEFLNWAKDCYIKYHNRYKLRPEEKEGGEKEYKGLKYGDYKIYKYFIKTDKAKDNSNVKQSVTKMFDIKRYIDNRKMSITYEEFMTRVVKGYGLSKVRTIDDIVNGVFGNYDPSLLFNSIPEGVGSGNIKSIFVGAAVRLGYLPKKLDVAIEYENYTLEPYKSVNEFVMKAVNDPLIAERISRGISKYESYDGVIMIPLTEKQYEMISKGSLSSKLLDGGIVTVDSLHPYDSVNLSKFEKFSDISLEKIKL